jgi:hypothetical protein
VVSLKSGCGCSPSLLCSGGLAASALGSAGSMSSGEAHGNDDDGWSDTDFGDALPSQDWLCLVAAATASNRGSQCTMVTLCMVTHAHGQQPAACRNGESSVAATRLFTTCRCGWCRCKVKALVSSRVCWRKLQQHQNARGNACDGGGSQRAEQRGGGRPGAVQA